MTKKIPISFNADDEKKVKRLVSLMGIAGTYGDFPKAVKFGITLALSALENPHKVYSSLSGEELGVYFQSIKRAEIIKRNEALAKKLRKSEV